MIFALYFIVGVLVMIPRFPRWFVAWNAREWPILDWDTVDTFGCVFITFFAIIFWPLVTLVALIGRLSRVSIHSWMVKQYAKEKEKIKK